jgi:pyruvate kinase
MQNLYVTVGPSSFKKNIIKDLSIAGATLFRINMSHTNNDNLETVIKSLQDWSDVPVCIDSEGAQVRNISMESENEFFSKDSLIDLYDNDGVIGNSSRMSLVPPGIIQQVKVGDHIRVDFDSVEMEVLEISKHHITAKVLTEGFVGSNKACDISRNLDMPALTDKDKLALDIAKKCLIKDFSLSFCNRSDDVIEMRRQLDNGDKVISKIESILGVRNIESIAQESDELLIDRGDLSREVPIASIPFIQRSIIGKARAMNIPVNVATNLLESMINKRTPTRSEVNDVVSTLLMGANGLVLAAETAIGDHPVLSVKMIKELIDATVHYYDSGIESFLASNHIYS